MTDTAALKRAIRKRMFLAKARPLTTQALYGWRWCLPCRGSGDVCREYERGDERWAVFELCEDCGGEGVVEAD
ncbi:hypothetical protein [Lysobacter enzymogenes]|uniref:hypothetical protein n=1 Tax=Lysobacter enzymogenes TaxID=69 RepID=UPI001A95BD91|nr:hypothetical protein [Lysobacter enzymogenes]QQP94410.1 hypothetical protein JHW38_14155 [Lysobacter enzymogenes]